MAPLKIQRTIPKGKKMDYQKNGMIMEIFATNARIQMDLSIPNLLG